MKYEGRCQIQTRANEVLEKTEFSSMSPHFWIIIWKSMDRFHTFFRQEKEELGVVTGEESDFLATHDAWRGYPRMHICQERLIGNSPCHCSECGASNKVRGEI